jgi:hypothetical protein
MSYTKTQHREQERDTKRMAQLRERALHDPAVHRQLVEIMEEDPDLVKVFSKHVERKYGSNWDKLDLSEKSKLVKREIAKNRVPTNKKGGKKTNKKKTNKKKTNKKKTNKKKTNKNKTNKNKTNKNKTNKNKTNKRK